MCVLLSMFLNWIYASIIVIILSVPNWLFRNFTCIYQGHKIQILCKIPVSQTQAISFRILIYNSQGRMPIRCIKYLQIIFICIHYIIRYIIITTYVYLHCKLILTYIEHYGTVFTYLQIILHNHDAYIDMNHLPKHILKWYNQTVIF